MTLSEKRTGQAACLLIIGASVLFIISVIIFSQDIYFTPKRYVPVFGLKKLIPAIPSLLLVFANIPLFAGMYFFAGTEKKIFALAGVIAATGYIVCSATSSFIQLSFLPGLIKSGNYGTVDFLNMTNPQSVICSLANLGYLFLAVSFLFFSFLFNQRGLQSWIKSTFVIYPIAVILGTIGYLADIRMLESMILLSFLPYLAGIILSYVEFSRARVVL